MSNSKSIGAKTGSRTCGHIAEKISKIVPPACPLRIVRIALRWSSSADSSTIGRTCPLPSSSRPGHQTAAAKFNPSSETSPKCPLSMRMPIMPSHWPVVGAWLKSHGHPGSQLQFLNHAPSIDHVSVMAAPPIFELERTKLTGIRLQCNAGLRAGSTPSGAANRRASARARRRPRALAVLRLVGAVDLVPSFWDGGGSYVAGGVILASAIYQLTPLKDACLSRCRGPLDFLTERWRDGVGGALRLGLEHGAWCVGCCWALMAALFALGLMSIAWMALIAALIAAEKLLPWKQPANRAVAGLLAVLGLAVALIPASVPGLTPPGQTGMRLDHGTAMTGGMRMGGKNAIGMHPRAETTPRGAHPVDPMPWSRELG